jgi:hypothetical protein
VLRVLDCRSAQGILDLAEKSLQAHILETQIIRKGVIVTINKCSGVKNLGACQVRIVDGWNGLFKHVPSLERSMSGVKK